MDPHFYRPAHRPHPARIPWTWQEWIEALIGLICLGLLILAGVLSSGCQTFKDAPGRPIAAYDDSGPLAVSLRAYPPVLLTPGEVILTTRILGELPDCARVDWVVSSGSSSHTACPPERSYRKSYRLSQFGRHRLIVYVQTADGRRVSDSVEVQVGAE